MDGKAPDRHAAFNPVLVTHMHCIALLEDLGLVSRNTTLVKP